MVQGSVPLLLSDLLVYVTTGALVILSGEYLITDTVKSVVVVSKLGIAGALVALTCCYAVGFVFLSLREWMQTMTAAIDRRLKLICKRSISNALPARERSDRRFRIFSRRLLSRRANRYLARKVADHGLFGLVVRLADIQFARSRSMEDRLVNAADRTYRRLVFSGLRSAEVPPILVDEVEYALIQTDEESGNYFYRLGILSTFGDSLAFLLLLCSIASIFKWLSGNVNLPWHLLAIAFFSLALIVCGQACRLNREACSKRVINGIASRIKLA